MHFPFGSLPKCCWEALVPKAVLILFQLNRVRSADSTILLISSLYYSLFYGLSLNAPWPKNLLFIKWRDCSFHTIIKEPNNPVTFTSTSLIRTLFECKCYKLVFCLKGKQDNTLLATRKCFDIFSGFLYAWKWIKISGKGSQGNSFPHFLFIIIF